MAMLAGPSARRHCAARVGPLASSGNAAIGPDSKPDTFDSPVTVHLRHFGRWHSRDDDADLAPQSRRVGMAFVETWIGRHCGEARRLLRRQACGARAEVALRGGLGAEYAAAPFDHVQVQLENALLVEDRLE